MELVVIALCTLATAGTNGASAKAWLPSPAHAQMPIWRLERSLKQVEIYLYAHGGHASGLSRTKLPPAGGRCVPNLAQTLGMRST